MLTSSFGEYYTVVIASEVFDVNAFVKSRWKAPTHTNGETKEKSMHMSHPLDPVGQACLMTAKSPQYLLVGRSIFSTTRSRFVDIAEHVGHAMTS